MQNENIIINFFLRLILSEFNAGKAEIAILILFGNHVAVYLTEKIVIF